MSKRTERMSRSAAERINRKDTVIRQNNAELEELRSQYENLDQVIAKLAVLVRNLEPKQGRIREEHDLWNEKWIIAHVRRTLISYGLYESGKS